MKRGGKILAVIGAMAAALLLTGCLQKIDARVVADLPAYSVVQQRTGAFEGRLFGYIDAQGVEHSVECVKEDMFSPRICESEDGVVSFSYTVHKSSVKLRRITVDGSERPMTKVYAHIEGISRVWVPSDKLEADQ